MEGFGRVVLMDNHDAAYLTWRDAGVKDRVLVHIDAHHDLAWRGRSSPLGIGNFICQAMADDLVREVWWVLPDPTWNRASDRSAIVAQLRKLLERYPDPKEPLQIDAHAISTRLLGRAITVCPLESLPAIDATVLLDIDTDYLVVPHVYEESDAHRQLPWCWPEELVRRLTAARLRTDLTTIARSVEGGYTPLKWKYLADELAARLPSPDHSLPFFDAMREGACAAHRHDFDAATAWYRRAADAKPESPAPLYHQALLALDADRRAEAQGAWQASVERDPSYRTPFGNSGLAYFREHRFAEAEREHQRALILDPEDPYAYFGLGRLAVIQRRWSAAERLLRQAIAIKEGIVEAHRALGYVLGKQRRFEEAIAAYDRSLTLALAGHARIDGPIATEPLEDRFDSDHCRVHARVAHLYARAGDRRRAIAAYRMSLATGHGPSLVRGRLALLYARQREWSAALGELGRAVGAVGGELRGARQWVSRYGRDIIAQHGRMPTLVPSDLL